MSAAVSLNPAVYVRARFRRWWRSRLPRTDTQTLTQGNVYILPTRAGWMFGLTLIVLLLASVNYQLNLGYVLTFLLAGSGMVSMHITHGTLRGLTLHLRPVASTFAGSAAVLDIVLTSPGSARFGVGLRVLDAPAETLAWINVPGGGQTTSHVTFIPDKRGRHEVPTLSAETRFPLGLFRAWTVWRPAATLLVYPKLEVGAPALPAARPVAGGPTQRRSSEGGEIEGVRAYRRGDPLKLVAWKKAAQALETGAELVSRDTSISARQELWLDWSSCASLAPEERLSRLAAWTLAATRAGADFGLRLPGVELEPATGEPQQRRSLEALALGPDAAMSTLTLRGRWPQWPGWRQLPREARDTLFLLAVIAWTVLPHAEHLPTWAIALTAIVLVWRGRLALVGGALPGRWVLVAVLALAIGLTLWSYRTLLGKEPGVTLAVALMALKTLELRARRDAFVVFFLGFFIILTHFLYSQSLPVAVAMLVSVWGLLTALVLAHMPVGQPSLRQASGLAARTALFGAPVMALLFVLFPRIGPLWGVPQDGISTTGLSNTMKMGSMTEVARDDSIAMRLRFEGVPPPPPERYFRGPVLTRFDGVEWRPTGLPFAAAGVPPRPPLLKTQGEPVRYEVTLEPLRLSSIPLLVATTSVSPIEGFRISPRDDLQWLTERAVFERVRFKAEAYTRFTLGLPRRAGELQDALDLPPGYNPRTLAWARDFRDEPLNRGVNATVFAQAVLQHIRTGGYSYTLAPGNYGRDGIDEFWLDRKEGFCEHFAAAFVVVMRAAGFPARVVTGYQGTDPTPTDGFYIVRQSSAHAWAEFWQSGVGWVRADPTGAVAPDRIGRSSRLAPQPGFVAETLASMSPEFLATLRNSWEAINNRWNQWVLNYSRGQQLDVLKNIGFESPSWEDLATLLIGLLSAFAFAGAAWAWFDRHRIDPWVRQLDRMKRLLRSLGMAAAPHEAPRTLAARVRERLGAAGEPLAAAFDMLEAQRYSRASSKRPDRELTRRFAADARRLKPTAAR